MAQVTQSEYQNASNAMSDRYTSDSLQSYTNAYNDYMAQWMSSSDAANKARGLLVENTPSQTSTTPSTSNTANWYQNQWAWNYVYNPVTEMYENQSSPSSTQTTPTVNQNTTQNQQQTVGSTVNNIQQQGALKPLSQEYYNQTNDNALNTIRNNLNNYRQTNPEYFTDYDSFKRNFSYDSRNDEQKNLLDEWYKWYTQQLQLSSVPTTDLYTQYKDGQVSATELEWLRISNPEKYAELQSQINKWNIVAAYDDDKWVDTTGMNLQDMAYQMASQIFTKFMSWDTTTEATQYFRDLEEKMNSPEMMEIQDKTTDLQEQIENINDDRARIKKEVEEEYAGTGATRSKINAIIADRSYELDLQLRTLNSEYNKYATQYNNRVQQYQNEFQLQLQEYQVNMQARQQQMDELGFAVDLMSFETPQQAQERQWNYWVMQKEYVNWDINSSNPTVQLKAIQNSVDELLNSYAWIPTLRSNVQIAQDIQTAIKNGSNIGAELTKLNQQMQSKPEYKLMYNATYWGKQTLGTINWMSAVINYDANGNYTWYKLLNTEPNSIENTTRQGQISSFKDVWDMSSDWDSYYNNLVNAIKLWSWGWQCGAWANDILVWAWWSKVFWDSLSSKISVCQQKYSALASNLYNDLKAWQFAVIDTWAKLSDWTPAGHVGLITSVDLQNRTITVLDSNGQGWKSCWGQSTYSIDKVRGAYTPNIWTNPNYQWPTSNNQWWYSDQRIGVYEKYLKGTMPTEKYVESVWWWDKLESEVAAYQRAKANNRVTANQASYAPYNNPMADAYETALANATTDAKSKSLNDAFNFYSQAYSMISDDSLKELANDTDLQEVIKDAYKNRNKSSIKGDVFTYMYNKKLTDSQRTALNQLKTLCNLKLRRESWAAINAEERESAYEFFFPSLWESPTYTINKILGNVNSTVWQWFLNWWVSRTDFVPLTADMISNSWTSNTSTSNTNKDLYSEWRKNTKTSTNSYTNWVWINNSNVTSYSVGGYTITRP